MLKYLSRNKDQSRVTWLLPLLVSWHKLALRETSMETSKILKLMILTILLVLTLKVDCQLMPPSPRPLCISQFALVNHACAMLPFNPNPAPVPPSPDEPGQSHAHSPGHGHGHGHGEGHGHGHSHSHRHGIRHRHQQSSAEEACCRWLKEIDDECVCDLLAHLPLFLTRPSHYYTVSVDPSCSVTFSCGGRLRAWIIAYLHCHKWLNTTKWTNDHIYACIIMFHVIFFNYSNCLLLLLLLNVLGFSLVSPLVLPQ